MQKPVLVLGATGTQGGAVATALLAAGRSVHALVRSPQTPAAKGLAARGVTLVTGEMDDRATLEEAMTGVDGLFSVPLVGGEDDPGLELRTGQAVIAAAVAADVPMVVHSSVARAGEHAAFTGWNEGRWWVRYWEDKAALNEIVRTAGLQRWTILKPAVLMDNYLPPKSLFMAPQLAQGEIVTAMKPETKLDIISAEDVGAFAAAAFAEPRRFADQEISLAAESLTMASIAAVLSEVTGKAVKAVHLSPEQAIAAGLLKMVVDGHQWDDVEGYRVDIDALQRWGIELTPFREWATRRAAEFSFIGGT